VGVRDRLLACFWLPENMVQSVLKSVPGKVGVTHTGAAHRDYSSRGRARMAISDDDRQSFLDVAILSSKARNYYP
jgi:hypothetical protein